jgi:nucleoside-diphosphate-sugar epimerase
MASYYFQLALVYKMQMLNTEGTSRMLETVGTRVLVTGGGGLIGKPLCDYLLDLGCEVHVMDDFSNSDPANVDERCHVHVINLVNNDRTIEIITSIQPSVIYHLACHPYEGLSQFCPHDVSMTTYMATVHVVSGAIKSGSVKRFVNYSSMARYGSGHRKDNGEILYAPFYESFIPNPEDVYAVSKVGRICDNNLKFVIGCCRKGCRNNV